MFNVNGESHTQFPSPSKSYHYLCLL